MCDGSCATPMSRTSVPSRRASVAQSGAVSCADRMVTWRAIPRCVTGMPAAAGTASALVTPGTTSTGTPAARHASTSSPPRPSTNESPPLSRTTRWPARARSTRTALISVCVRVCACGDLPASMISTAGSSSASSARGASRSTTTTSASASARRPRVVMSPGSPGPPPTSVTRPVVGRWWRRGSPPVSSRSAIALRSATARRGSPPAPTATVTSPERATAGVQALDALASSARTHHSREASASAATASSTARSPVAVCTSQAPSRSVAR